MKDKELEELKKKQDAPPYNRDKEIEDLKSRFKYVEERLSAVEKSRREGAK